MNELRLSASAIEAYKACPARFLLGYVYGWQSEKEKDSLRVGTNWHRCHEILHLKPNTKCPECLRHEKLRPDCDLCAGTGVLPASMMDSVVRFLNREYAIVPENKTREEWETERIKLLYSLVGYYHHYGWEDDFETIGVEVWFDLPIIDPATGKKLPKARMVGKVDRLARHKQSGLIYMFERKSTSKNLSDSTYWNRLATDDQLTIYLDSLRRMQMQGKLAHLGIKPDDPLIQGAWYDVWSKPETNPKALTQADSVTFVQSGEYCGQKFNLTDDPCNGDLNTITVNGCCTPIVRGKKENTFSIYETPEMYGARLLQDICQEPETYFAQREIARTDQQLVKYQQDLANLVKLIRYTEKHGLWFEHDRMCEAPYRCEFLEVHNQLGCLRGPEEVLEGFRRKNGNPNK